MAPTLAPVKRPDQAWSPNTKPMTSKALSDADLVKIADRGTELRPALEFAHELRKANSELRQKLWEIASAPPPGLVARCATAISTLFGAKKPSIASLKRFMQNQISENVKDLKRLFEQSIQPSITEIKRQHQGKTFTRTKDTPRVLLLAAVPTEKVNKLPTHSQLMIRIENYIQNSANPRAKVLQNKIGERMVLVRTNSNNEKETLELSFSREGKVDVTVTSKSGITQKSIWNDDAELLAKSFAAGKNFRFEPKKYKHYTVA